MAKIYAPETGYTGVSASVAFCNGVGYTDNKHLIQWFKEKGYKVEEEKPPKDPAQKKPDKEPAKKPDKEPDKKPDKESEKESE